MKTHSNYPHLLLCLLILFSPLLSAQSPDAIDPISIQEEQELLFQQLQETDSLEMVLGRPPINLTKGARSSNCQLKKQVYGYHPHWMNKYYKGYDYSLLSTFSYFSYQLNPKTGLPKNKATWLTHPSIDLAKRSGCKVELCVTNFNKHATFLNNPKAWRRLSAQLLEVFDRRGIDGINIDFEGIPKSQRANLTKFITYLSNRIKTAYPGATLTMALPAVDWYNVFEIAKLDAFVDAFVIMGYDYHWSKSKTAGAVAPLYGKLSLTKTVQRYLGKGMSNHKLILALPYYGREWRTKSTTVPSSTVKYRKAPLYRMIRKKYLKKHAANHHRAADGTPYFAYKKGKRAYQCWYDDAESLASKYDLVNQFNIGGVGIWALGYDNGYTDLWKVLENEFVSCPSTYTPVPEESLTTQLEPAVYFEEPEVIMTTPEWTPVAEPEVRVTTPEWTPVKKDTEVKITTPEWTPVSPQEDRYEAIETNSYNSRPPIYSPTVDASVLPNHTTIERPENQYTNQPAKAKQSSRQPVKACKPTTQIAGLSENRNRLFVHFDDLDECHAGWDACFYQVLTNQNGKWRANPNKGFFNEQFNSTALYPKWTILEGQWEIRRNRLWQIDGGHSNTNIYTNLSQDSQHSYLYHWWGNIDGQEGSRRAGLHFFVDDPLATHRNNAYLVYYRVDAQRVEIYKMTNNEYDRKTSQPYPLEAGTDYDFKVTYHPGMGLMEVYLDNELVSSWRDRNPIKTGNYISLRTGDAQASFDFMKVYPSRGPSVAITVGKQPNCEAYCDDDVYGTTCRVISIAKNNYNQWSNVDTEELKVWGE